jgi:arylsulfatase
MDPFSLVLRERAMIRSLALMFSIPMIAGGLLGAAAEGADGPRKPNIVFIMADDLGYGDLGCYGQKKIRTPHIDQLAAEGMRLTDYHSGSPVCAPSRCVLMTGKHTGHAYVRNNKSMKEYERESPTLGTIFGGQQPIPEEEVTLAELLKAQGYATGAFGKWGLGAVGTSGDPLSQGIDRFFGYNCQGHAHNFYPRYLVDDRENLPLEGNTHGLTGAQYAPDLYAEQALKFIRQHKDQPFFVYYPTIVPHLALQVPEDSLAEYRGIWEDPPYEGGNGYLPHPAPRAAYAAMVTRMDRDVGRIVDLVETLGLDERTIYVFTSDNGPTYGRLGGSDSDFFESAAGLRGLKGSVYEGGMRVPAIVRWTGRIEAGSKSALPTAAYDWMPTLLELIGAAAAAPKDIDGISFAPTLLGRPRDQQRHEYLYWEFPAYGGQQAVRLDEWKGVRQNLLPRRRDAAPNMAIELYNLREDRGESKNVAEKHPEIVAKIEQVMRTARTPSSEFRFPALDAVTGQ